ncbi:MAG: hypothetical protein PHV74_03835 [Dehalococcoidia bacterium]|nr:hypothetical protein [Dehalococcoidia bacterium]
MSFKIWGKVRELESKRGIAGLAVIAFDKDLLFDDLLGKATTDGDGNFQLAYEGKAFNQFFDSRPDIYLKIETRAGKLLLTTQDAVRWQSGKDEHFVVEIDRKTLLRAGLDAGTGAPRTVPDELKRLTCLETQPPDDPLAAAIKSDVEGKSSVLELMQSYLKELEGEIDNNAPPFAKLAKLFQCGKTPDRVEGHHYGITIGLRTGDKKGIWADFGNVLGFIWSTSLGKVPPWVGKSFREAGTDELAGMSGEYEKGDVPTFIGINHFNEIDQSPLNAVSLTFLAFWMRLEEAKEGERTRYGYEKEGGHFIARRAPSVYRQSQREVFQLNYRWPKLHNLPPLSYLIDEIVEIAEGLYLGQLLFATNRLFGGYDPRLPVSEYDYEHFGYFLLMDERWKTEAQIVFPYIGIPYAQRPKVDPLPQKFTTFTFADPIDGNCNDRLLAEIQEEMKDKRTILGLLKAYSDELREHPHTDSPYFDKLSEIFNRGVCPKELKGFFRGALVSFHSEGLLGIFKLNTLNMAWGLARLFTPWTGKTFEGIDPQQLREITEDHETGESPTFWGANTYSLRTTPKRLVGKAMKVAGLWTEDPAPEEKKAFGIDLKSFFFIGRQAASVNAENRGKQVFQFNYRWPNLRTFPPDNYCLDELVQIADGLYLGELMYATELLKKYDPDKDPSEYQYRNFGYFLLMDEEWHRRRLAIGFDLDNT